MAQLICEKVSRGMRDEERTVAVRDAATAQRSFIRVEADFLTLRGGNHYLPVGIVQEESQGLVLVELPQEPDAGNRRLWVRPADLWRGENYPGSSIQLEIWNFGPVTIMLKPGMKICQLIFETVDATPDMGYTGKFAVQGPTTDLAT